MNRVPDYHQDVSRRLSHVLDDIGVNERTVNVRRRTWLINETMEALSDEVLGIDVNRYYFGSQTEGATTLGLNSDTDALVCLNNINIIQDWSEWKRDKLNLLMIQNDTTPPGYCRLQRLKSSIPVAREDIPDQHFEYDDGRRVLMKNTYMHSSVEEGAVRHGPAATYEDLDIVNAFSCRNWPSEAETWVFRYYAKKSQNINLIRLSVQSGCFVVPTGHSSSPDEGLEWRISTSMAERYLMFNMNITQIRCYVLLKMIIKTFITPIFPDTISSYHCKTVLMYLVENSQNELWREEKLLLFVTLCLRLLYICICTNNCPHYFIHGNNLMAGRFDVRSRRQLLVAFEHIICNNSRVFFGIEIDNVGGRLKNKCFPMVTMYSYQTPDQTHYHIYSELYFLLVNYMVIEVSNIMNTNEVAIQNVIYEMKTRLSAVLSSYRRGGDIEREASLLIIPSLCTTMGVIASILQYFTRSGSF